MKGYIAICQHFHQPYFQLHKTREQVYELSYLSWINLLEKLSTVNGFYMNIHFSGPFLYWLKDEKKEYLIRLCKIVDTGTLGIIGGFADEAFVQLSTRQDDILFQVKEYERLTYELFKMRSSEWQGFHIPERECGELLLNNTTRALLSVGAKPIYYLDAETFYQCHFSFPGGNADYCKRFFGFNDPVSKTSFSHYPKTLLRYAFRDIIGGQEFLAIPIHCEERYWFMKYDMPANGNPADYFHMIKKSLKEAHKQGEAIGRDVIPLAVIFEDAEKLGAWSGNPVRDCEWLSSLIELVCNDDEVNLIGLKDYCEEQGSFDTYPIRSSHSYIEFENWTAKRGIRGVVYGDEKIRKMVTLLHQLEYRTESFEKYFLKGYCEVVNDRLISSVMEAIDRYIVISELLEERINKSISDKYMLLCRIRNLLYQEDSKWAIRHPNYGSAPYLDNNGICLLEIAERILWQLESSVGMVVSKNDCITNWMEDYKNRFIIRTACQTVSVDPYGASIDYQIAINKNKDVDEILPEIMAETYCIRTYPSIYRYVSPVHFSETDSRLCYEFDEHGGRIERCRKSFSISLSQLGESGFKPIVNLSDLYFTITERKETRNGYQLVFEAERNIQLAKMNHLIKLKRKFLFGKNEVVVETSIEAGNALSEDLYLTVAFMTSLTASDEVDFCPSEGIVIQEGTDECQIMVENENDSIGTFNCSSDGSMVFIYNVHTGANDYFCNGLKLSLSTTQQIDCLSIAPAIKNFYENYVGKEQSCLGYTSSGVTITPFVKIRNGKAALTVKQEFLWDIKTPIKGKYISLT